VTVLSVGVVAASLSTEPHRHYLLKLLYFLAVIAGFWLSDDRKYNLIDI